MYLRVIHFDNKYVVVSTDKEIKASQFFVEKSVCPGEFNIAYYGKLKSSHTRSTKYGKYLRTNSRETGKDDNPPEMSSEELPQNFILKDRLKNVTHHLIPLWEDNPYYIMLGPRGVESYLVNNRELKQPCCVPKIENKENSVWQLQRVQPSVIPQSAKGAPPSPDDDDDYLATDIPEYHVDQKDFDYQFNLATKQN